MKHPSQPWRNVPEELYHRRKQQLQRIS